MVTSKKEILTCLLGHHASHGLLSRPKLDSLSVVYQGKLDYPGAIQGTYGCSQSLKHINLHANFPEVKSIIREKITTKPCVSPGITRLLQIIPAMRKWSGLDSLRVVVDLLMNLLTVSCRQNVFVSVFS